MTDLAATDSLFFERTGMDPAKVEGIVGTALDGMDDGELFLEYSQSEALSFDDGKLKSASFDTTQGFGLRAVSGEATGYAHAVNLDEKAIKRAAETVQAHAASLMESVEKDDPALRTRYRGIHTRVGQFFDGWFRMDSGGKASKGRKAAAAETVDAE